MFPDLYFPPRLCSRSPKGTAMSKLNLLEQLTFWCSPICLRRTAPGFVRLMHRILLIRLIRLPRHACPARRIYGYTKTLTALDESIHQPRQLAPMTLRQINGPFFGRGSGRYGTPSPPRRACLFL